MSGEDFSKFKVEKLKNYLRERGTQLSECSKAKRKVELFNLCKKAVAVKQIPLKTRTVSWRKSYRQVRGSCQTQKR